MIVFCPNLSKIDQTLAVLQKNGPSIGVIMVHCKKKKEFHRGQNGDWGQSYFSDAGDSRVLSWFSARLSWQPSE